MFRVGFCVSGQGRLFRSAIEHRFLLGITPALLVVERKASPDLKDFCSQHGIEYVNLDPTIDRQGFDNELTQICISANLDLIALTFDKIIPESLITHYPAQIINVHMSLLPAFKGFSAIQRALDTGVKYIGASIHAVTPDTDGGSLVCQCLVPRLPGDTVNSVGQKLYNYLELMYLQAIRWYAQDRIEYDAQNNIWIRDANYDMGSICPNPDAYFLDLLKKNV